MTNEVMRIQQFKHIACTNANEHTVTVKCSYLLMIIFNSVKMNHC